MRRAAPILQLALLLAIAFAGCLGGGSGPQDDDAATTSGTPTGSTQGGAPPAADVDVPTWPSGRSWTWELRSGALQETARATTVVLAADGATYDLGVSALADGAALHPFHLVALGAVDASCLCWDAHGTPVRLLQFPLREGSFAADFWSAPGATVTVRAGNVTGPDGPEPGYLSEVAYAEGGTFLRAEYAPARGQFVRVASHFGADEPFAEAVLLQERDGASGIAFRAVDLARYRASAGDPASLAPQAVNVPPGAEAVLLSCFLPAAQGAYFAQLSVAGVPIACGGGSADTTRYAGTYTEAQPGPGTVSVAIGGQGTLSVEAFAIDTTA